MKNILLQKEAKKLQKTMLKVAISTNAYQILQKFSISGTFLQRKTSTRDEELAHKDFFTILYHITDKL